MSARGKQRVLFLALLSITIAAFGLYLLQLYRVYSIQRPVSADTAIEVPQRAGRGAHHGIGSPTSSGDVRGSDNPLMPTLISERGHFYRPGELNRFDFAQEILATAVGTGLDTESFGAPSPGGAPGGDGTSLELKLSGAAEGLMRFVGAVELHEKYWSIDSCTIQRRREGVSAELVVGYREYAKTDQ